MVNITFARATKKHDPQVKNPWLQGRHDHSSSTDFLSRFAFLYIFALVALVYMLRLLNHSS